jgi:hypothetical protein
MATNNQPNDLGDLLLVQVSPGWTKDSITLVAGSVYAVSQVLAIIDNKYQALDPANTGPANKAVAVLADPIDATTGDKPAAVIACGAVLALAELTWLADITAPQKASALDELIRVRLDDRDGLQTYWLQIPQRNTQGTQRRPLLPELSEQVAVLLDADGGGVYLGGIYSTRRPTTGGGYGHGLCAV